MTEELLQVMADLSERHRIVVTHLRQHPLEERAALDAAGYSPKTPPSRVVGHPAVARALAIAHDLEAKATAYDAEALLLDLVEMAHADIGDALEPSGRLKPLDEWPRGLRRLIKSIDVELGEISKVTFEGRGQCLQLIARHRNVRALEDVKIEARIFEIINLTGRSEYDDPATDVEFEVEHTPELGEGGELDRPGGEPEPDRGDPDGDAAGTDGVAIRGGEVDGRGAKDGALRWPSG